VLPEIEDRALACPRTLGVLRVPKGGNEFEYTLLKTGRIVSTLLHAPFMGCKHSYHKM